MRDLIEKILNYLPKYFTNFGSLFVKPKQFIGLRNTMSDDSFREALLFLGISSVLVVIMTAPLLPPGKDLWTHLGSNAVVYLLAVLLSALSLRLAWRIVGGKATVQSFFVTFAYFFGMVLVILTLFMLISQGVFKVFEPELYKEIIEAKINQQPTPDVSESSIPLVTLGINVVGMIIITVWSIVAWGAYRELNGVSKWRSILALIVTGILSWPIAAILYFVSSAIN